MKMLNIFLMLTFTVVLTSCSTNTAKHDYDAKAHFTNLNTFDWLVVPEKAQVDESVVKRVKDAVNRQLAAKGLREVSENPDFLIAPHIGKQLKGDENWGYSSRRYGSYRARRPIKMYEEGTLILDFVDTKTKELIWRGSASAVIEPVLTPEKREEIINEAVSKILKNFPAGSSQ